MNLAAIPEAIGLAVVILALGVSGATIVMAVTRYSDVDLQVNIDTKDITQHIA